jgi:hypothetical protein
VKISSLDKRAKNKARDGATPAARPRGLVLLLVISCLGCAGASKSAARAAAPPGASRLAPGSPVDFAFESLDERPVSAEASRGKPTVLVFITTSSLSSQAQVDFLLAMAKHDGTLVNYLAVALEGRENREMVELYGKALSISFPVAIADPQTLAGAGAFGDVSGVPVTVLLDRAGRVVWRADGRVVKSDEMRAAMRGL